MKTLVVVTALLLSAADWTSSADKLSKSVVFIENAEGSCTGFVIDSDAKDDKDYILTAAHCDGANLFVDQLTARVVSKNTQKDLMVVEVKDTGRPALRLAKDNPKIGEEVASLGYGWGLERPMFRTAHVSDDAMVIPDVVGGPFVAIDSAYVSGQSGGPVVNTAGEVVSIVQRSGSGVGIGVGAEMLRSKMGRWFEKVKP